MRATAALTAAVIAGGLAVAGPAAADTSPSVPGTGLGEPLRLVLPPHPGGPGGSGGQGGNGNGGGSGSGNGGSGSGQGGNGGPSGHGGHGPSRGHGTLWVRVPAAATLTLSGDRTMVTGNLGPVTVSDTRPSSPGWTVFGQASEAGGTIPGDALGWTPAVTSSTGRVSAGRPVPPHRPGLATAARLGWATGNGTALLGARLSLALPPRPAAGRLRIAIAITITVTTAAV